MRGATLAAATNEVSMVTVAPPAVRIHAVNASSAVHSIRLPSRSGRSATVTCVRAPASVSAPKVQRRKSMACDPHAPIHPPPRDASKSHPYDRSGMREPALSTFHCTCSTVPTAPSCTNSRSRARPG